MIKKITARVGIFALLLGLISLILFNNASAASVDEIYNNVLANTMFKCYTATEMNKEINMAEYNSYNAGQSNAKLAFSELILNGGGMYRIPTKLGAGNNTVANNNENGATQISCKTLFLGGDIDGIFAHYGKNIPEPQSSTVSTDLANIGYTEVTKEAGKLKCIKSEYRDYVNTIGGEVHVADAGSICWKVSDLPNMGTWEFYNNAVRIIPDYNAPHIEIDLGDGSSPQISFYDGSTTDVCHNTKTLNDGDDKSAFIDYMASGERASCERYIGEKLQWKFTLSVVIQDDTAQAFEKRSMSSYAWAYGVARKFFTGNTNLHDFDKNEKFTLYNAYLFDPDIYAANWVSGTPCLTRTELEAAGGPVQGDVNGGKFYAYKDGQYCRVEIPDSQHYNLDVSIFNDNKYMNSWCNDVACLLKSIYNLQLPDKDNSDDSGDSGDQGGGTTVDTEEDFCDSEIDKATNGEGIGAMQWVLCPSLSNTTYTADWIDGITQDWLEVNSDVYKPGGSVYKFTDEIKKVADVLMTAFLLVIIFSQLTGYGIDNYGIKKMLPRLIVMAIIVNLAYYICAIAIDLSNVAGEGLRNMFGNMGNFIAGGGAAGGDNGFVKTGVLGLFTAAGTGGGAAMSAAGVALSVGAAGWVAIVVAAIVLVLVVIVAVIIMYLMLGVRNVIVIFCIVISPLAFAMFILPNTQHLFKKWWELFKTAIIIYPICGAMSGISYALKNMNLGETSGVATQMIVIVLPYLGFFLIPMLIKNAIAALGKIGGALTAVGNTMRQGGRMLGSGAMRGVQNTEAYKNRQLEAARNRQLRNADRTIRRLEDIKKNGGELDEAQTRRLARAHETQRKLGLENQAARTVLAEKEYADKSQLDLMVDWKAAFKSGDTERMDALTNVISSKYGPGGASDIAKSLDDMGDKIFTDANMSKSFSALQANMLQNKTLAANMQSKASDAYQMISGGGFGKDGNKHNLKWHSAHNSMATQDKDWATQSNATLKRAAANGGLNSNMAKQLLASTDPSIKSGLLSDAEKRQTLEAIAGGYAGDWNNDAAVESAANNYKHQTEMDELHGQAMEEMKAEMAQRARDDVEQRKAEALESINSKLDGGSTGGSTSGHDHIDMNGGDGDGATGEVE